MLIDNSDIAFFKDYSVGDGILSLAPLESYLQHILDKDGGRRHLLPWFGLEMIKNVQQVHGPISLSNLQPYEGVFEMIHSLQDGLHLKEQGLWAIADPLPKQFICGSQPFYDLANSSLDFIPDEKFEFLTALQNLMYGELLERFYDLPKTSNGVLFRKIDNGLQKYYRLFIDYSFVEIQPKDKLFQIDLTPLKDKDSYCIQDIQPIVYALNPENFIFKGFTILKFEEETSKVIESDLHKIIGNLSQYKIEQLFADLNEIFTSISGTKAMNCSLMPILELNQYPILSLDRLDKGIFFRELNRQRQEGVVNDFFTQYLEQPYPIILGVDAGLDSNNDFIDGLIKSNGIQSYIIFPLKQRESIVGYIELYSATQGIIDKSMLVKWRNFIPLLTQLASDIIYIFKNSLARIIMNNYTGLNPAVEWRFNEVAANKLGAFMRDEEATLSKVRFDKVYPVYGAIDVKGSTELRNTVYQKDSVLKINSLERFLNTLNYSVENKPLNTLRRKLKKISNYVASADFEKHIIEVFFFLQEEVVSSLKSINEVDNTYHKAIADYIEANQGVIGYHNDLFEESLQRINRTIKSAVLAFNAKVQEIFPSYFELFRTDGIEYDMYIGQSITPSKKFDSSLLRDIRREQIISMANIGIELNQLKNNLPEPMEVTLLIFMHSSTIDISFREDERRFDVEGGYNIRYHVVKKRIDKVRIKHSKERLVRPNTIAIVYQGDALEEEIRSLMADVVKLNLIESDWEFCTLEDIKGVSELRAIRANLISTT